MERRVRVVPAVMLAALIVLGAACGVDGTDDGRDAEAPSTTAGGPAAADADGVPVLPAEVPPSDEGPSGSGCTPGPGKLPDGWWYGGLPGFSDGEVTFDLACYYVGEAAEAEAADRDEKVDHGHLIVNDNKTLRTMPVAPDAAVTCVETGERVHTVDCFPADVEGEWGVWVRVQGGTVDRIIEQYAP